MRHVLALVILTTVVTGLLGSCAGLDPLGGDSNTPTSIGGTVNVVDFTVAAGQTTTVAADVVINASGNVRIEGVLASATVTTAGAKGYDITIVAQGDIEVTGTIQAGNGAAGAASTAKLAPTMQATGDQADAPGGDGGTIELRAGGNLTIGATASLTSGTGGIGGTGPWGGAGGSGGDVRLAAGGQLNMQGSLAVGNGGDGGSASPAGSLSGNLFFGGRGGDSGVVFAKAGAVNWPGYNAATNSLDPVQGATFSGGYGGNAPPLLTLTDGALPGAKPVRNAQMIRVTGACWGSDCTFGARDGGNGFFGGGAGGSIAVAITELSPGTYDGPVITVRAGHGGNIIRKTNATYGESIAAVFAYAGAGGQATVTAPRGRDGDLVHYDGGYGGTAIAYGGNGGSGAMNLLQYGGAGGAARAQAGAGGFGHDGCYTIGNGGAGGIANAYGGKGGSAGFGGSGGNATAIGGEGGGGGNGGHNPGSGGAGGAAVANSGDPGQYNAGFYSNTPIFGAIESQTKGIDGDPGVADVYSPSGQGNSCPDAVP